MKTMTHECPRTLKFVFFTHLMHLLRPPGVLEETFETPHPFSPCSRTPLSIIALPRRIRSLFRTQSDREQHRIAPTTTMTNVKSAQAIQPPIHQALQDCHMSGMEIKWKGER